MNHHWVANRDLTVKGGVKRAEGEYVPEAYDWRDPELWERAGYVRKVQGPPSVMGDPKAAVIPVAEPTEAVKPEALRTLSVSPKPAAPPAHAPGPEDHPVQDKLARINRDIAEAWSVSARPDLGVFGPNKDLAAERIKRLERAQADAEADAREQEREAAEPIVVEPEPIAPEPDHGTEVKFSRSRLSRMKAADVHQVAKGLGIESEAGGMTKAQTIDAILER